MLKLGYHVFPEERKIWAEYNILDSIADIPDLTLREQYEFARPSTSLCQIWHGVLNDLIKNKKSKDEGELKIKNSIMSIYYDLVFQYARNRKYHKIPYHKSNIELPQHYRLDHDPPKIQIPPNVRR